MIFTSTSRACTFQRWRDSLPDEGCCYGNVTHRRSSCSTCGSCTVTHESYSKLLLFAEQQLRASVFNNASYQMFEKTQRSIMAKGRKAFSSSFIQEILYTEVIYALVKSRRDESAKNVYPAVVLFRFFFFLQDFFFEINNCCYM